MFASLRARLLVSYIVVIVVCLMLAALALVLVARPVQERLAMTRLSAQVTLVLPRVQRLLQEGLAPEQVAERLSPTTDRRGMRVLLLDRHGRVLGDTDGAWIGQAIDGLAVGPDGQPQKRGTLTAPDGSRQIYVGDAAGRTMWVAAIAASPRTPAAVLGDLGQGLLVAGLVALVLSALLALLIARSVARPLRQMALAAEAIATQDYDQKLDIQGPEEVRVLAESFEAMARQVQASQQAMRDLVSNVSHDLKTPLTSVQGFAQALLDGAAQDEEARRRAASVIYEEAGRMVRMVEDLLELARMEAGQVVLERRPLDLKSLVDGAARALAPLAAQKGVTLTVDVPDLPPITGDGDRLLRMLTNLLDNALKFTSTGDRVHVRAQVVQGQAPPRRSGASTGPEGSTLISLGKGFVEVSVADTGRGIPAEDLPRIFERFYQVDKARSALRGSGLGLAIAKQVVEAHNGWIGVESVAGVGTRFTVALPLSGPR
jgi:signal transduction histidine kinase